MRIKLLFSSVLALLPLIGVAQRISDAQAMSIAESVLGKQVIKAMPSKVLYAPSVNGGAELKEPFYKIFNGEDGNGFVIVSNDRRAPKVFGYGEGKCDPNNLPVQLAAILAIEDSVLNAEPTLPEHPSWQKRAPRLIDAGVGGKLNETAKWGQKFPFNENTPIKDGQHCVTGCVATAMAIVMKYNSWPKVHNGNSYNWDDMPLETVPNTSYPEIARLMADTGEAVYMHYGLGESAASTNWAGHKLQSEFQYSPKCQYISKDNFNREEWIGMLREEIDNDRVVIYAGGGHAYIVDGYDSDGLYHVNWGWAGYCDGYFPIDSFKPQNDNFSEDACMIINIMPDDSNKKYSENFVDFGYFWGDKGAFSGCMVDCDQLHNGEKFNFICYFYNLVPGFVGEVGIALMDENDNIKGDVLKSEYVSTWSEHDNKFVLTGHDLRLLEVTIPEGIDIQPTDRLQVVSKADGEDEWLIMLGTIEAPSYLNVSDVKASVSDVRITVTAEDVICFYGYTNISIPGYFGKIDQTGSYLTGAGFVCQAYRYQHPEATVRITVTSTNPEVEPQVATAVGTCTNIFNLNRGHYDVLVEIVEPEPQDVLTDVDGIRYQIYEDYASVLGFDPSYSSEPFIPVEISYSGITYPVTEIADNAFENTDLERLYIQAKLTRIGERAFANCAFLSRVYVYNETPAELHSTAFDEVNISSVFVNVPLNSYLVYKDADNWKELNLMPMGGTLSLSDDIEYLIDKDVYGCTMSYTRTVSSVNWMGVYLPFEIDVTTMDGTYATLTAVSSDGVLEWTTQESGKISACTPFIFKPEAVGDITFRESPVVLNSCNTANPVNISGYKLEGNFQTKTDMAIINGNALSNGNFYRTSNVEKTLKPYRIFLTVPSQVLQTKAPVRSRVNGQEVTAIEDILIDTQDTNGHTYNLQGISVGSDYNGVVIINGKKVIRK